MEQEALEVVAQETMEVLAVAAAPVRRLLTLITEAQDRLLLMPLVAVAVLMQMAAVLQAQLPVAEDQVFTGLPQTLVMAVVVAVAETPELVCLTTED
jgi:hypothetical protein